MSGHANRYRSKNDNDRSRSRSRYQHHRRDHDRSRSNSRQPNRSTSYHHRQRSRSRTPNRHRSSSFRSDYHQNQPQRSSDFGQFPRKQNDLRKKIDARSNIEENKAKREDAKYSDIFLGDFGGFLPTPAEWHDFQRQMDAKPIASAKNYHVSSTTSRNFPTVDVSELDRVRNLVLSFNPDMFFFLSICDSWWGCFEPILIISSVLN